MTRQTRPGRTARIFVATALVLAAGLPARGQVPEPAAPKYTEVVAPMQDMRDGRKNVMDESGRKILPENKEAMTRMAKFLTYRLAQPVYHEPDKGDPRDEKTIAKLMDEAQRWLIHNTPDRKLSPRQAEFALEFAKVMNEQLKFVLANSSKPIVRLNAVRMLALVAKMPYPGTADALMAVVNDTRESDGVRLYAFQGLRNLVAQDAGDGTYIIDDPAKLAPIANTLIKIVTAPHPDLPKDPREAAAIPFVRREAIRALGAFHHSVLRNRSRDVLARPGLPLLRIALLGDKNFTPPMTNAERAEALFGFCQMRQDKEMRMDVAAAAVNATVLHFVRLQNEERGTNPPSMPWKVFGARLGAAMNAWKTNAADMPNSTNPKPIIMLSDRILPIARALEDKGTIAQYDAGPLNDWATNQVPQAPFLLFKDDKDSDLSEKNPAAGAKGQ